MATIPLSLSKQPPIGLHLDGEWASLAQVTVQSGRPVIQAVAAGELPADPADAAAALRRLLADHHFAGRTVISSLPTADMTVQNVRLPQVPDVELPPLLRFEAQERLPYPVDDAELRHLVAGVAREEGVVKQETILLAARREAIDRHIALLDAGGLTPSAIDLAGCGLLRCVAAAEATLGEAPGLKDGGLSRRACVYFGSAAVTVLVAEGGHIVFLKHLPCGGRHLDQTLARATNLSEPEAASMRRTLTSAASLDAEDDLHRTVIDGLRTSLEALATDIELCLRHVQVTFRGPPPQSLAVTGPDASSWLADFLADRLRLDSKVFHPFRAFGRGATVPEPPGRFSIAVGLSLRGLTPKPVATPTAVPA
jgi:type IV pilus assembly protein PilM